MDYIIFIFKSKNNLYCIPSGSLDEAWFDVAKRLSCRVEIAKQKVSYVGCCDGMMGKKFNL